ncbi:rho GTPase-activating protein 19-like isoform X3 [Spodoptera litura]|uniref:Rho GTPase-activating protein 19-like isoform X3 n=1 Tax=Spodoptera litura TaxID=69820 RepID=A0A9J7EH48_SPOLT|nr:rho GTPase-activating protein 19-like isoform X3 [Spodoptera litura]
MTSADLTLIERLRKENLEQFFTLVRMHLSFVVDINTDDVDCSTDKPKQFRWNFHKKTKNSNSNSSQNNANITKNNVEVSSITEDGILRVNELIDFLSKPDNVTQEGIFRRTGSLSRQQELKNLLLTGSNLGLDDGKFSVHDCASVLKGFLAELPQPLLMDQYYQTYCTLAAQYPPNADSSEVKLLTALQLLLLLLTPSHRNFLQRLLRLLRLTADNEASNRMSPDTLATMFTPHLLCPRKLSPETFHADSIALSPVISFMIRQSSKLFDAPTQLVTDAAAYLTVREKRRAMSPLVDLDESITDKTAASTVYTFVDRPRTRAENAANPTDTALAQLYAHIQALPDSSHKRRLIKHFNRQNGYGTPIQIQRTGKVAGSRSFGDSIKRHIFNKGLLNKTPKKGSGSNINVIEEESIMTPRSRKPLIITSEQRDMADTTVQKDETTKSDVIYQSMSPKNDSDFVSSDDDDVTRSTLSCERSRSSQSASTSLPRTNQFDARSINSIGEGSPIRPESTRFVLSRDRPNLVDELNTTLCGSDDGLPKFAISYETNEPKCLSEPFREYLLSRSVLTATPIDLSILNKSNDTDDKISDSLLYCLDGNVPSDLTLSISNLAVDKESSLRSPLTSISVNIDKSPNRKRLADNIGCIEESTSETKKLMVAKENIKEVFEIRETEL